MRYMEVYLHKQPMKTILKCIVIANTVSAALKIINASYPYPLFEAKDVVTSKFVSKKTVDKTIAEEKLKENAQAS